MYVAPLAYIGPETILPLTSVLAALGGTALLFWGYVRRAVAWCLHLDQRPKTR